MSSAGFYSKIFYWIKALHRLSDAYAWIAAAAFLSRATLLHKDPEFEAITALDQSWLA